MSQASCVEELVADVVGAIRKVPAVRGVTAEAPREDRDAQPFKGLTPPHVFVWEDDEGPPINSGTNQLKCELPIHALCFFKHADGELRTTGRRIKAQLEAAIVRDSQRGIDPTLNRHRAIDTSYQGGGIAPSIVDGHGLIELLYLVTYERHFRNPYGVTPPEAA